MVVPHGISLDSVPLFSEVNKYKCGAANQVIGGGGGR